MANYRGKRAFDLLVSVPLLILTLPLQAVVAVVVARSLGRPVIFRQLRPGQYGAPFQILKFRTMLPVDPTRGWIDDETRITHVGKILRQTSLDELPSLWNILRGEMSVVGPRPLRMQYLDRYTPEQFRRHDVRPGITGLAQVSGRNGISWKKKFEFDVEYVRRSSIWFDIRILALTVLTVLKREGISAPGRATMSEFTADDPEANDARRPLTTNFIGPYGPPRKDALGVGDTMTTLGRGG